MLYKQIPFQRERRGEVGGGEIVEWWGQCLTGGEERFHPERKEKGSGRGRVDSGMVGAVSDWW